jgi:hypothetical protein
MRPAPPSRSAAEARYRDIRLAALKTAEDIASAQLATRPVRLDIISAAALATFRDHWVGHSRRRYPWPWAEIVENARKNEPDRFEAAVWSGDTLCGLAIGWTRKEFCRVDYLEGSPVPDHPLRGRVAVIVFGAAVAYATALGRAEVCLINPLPAVVPRYEALGFKLASPKGETPYCWWKVR